MPADMLVGSVVDMPADSVAAVMVAVVTGKTYSNPIKRDGLRLVPFDCLLLPDSAMGLCGQSAQDDLRCALPLLDAPAHGPWRPSSAAVLCRPTECAGFQITAL